MDEKELQERVKNLLLGNIVEGYSKHLKTNFSYVKPSTHRYPYQWWWDTFFHIFILLRLSEYELAKRNLRSLFAMQEENGFVGHMIFWNGKLPRNRMEFLQSRPSLHQLRPHMSAIIQPPLVAQALLRIFEETKNRDFLLEMLPKVKKYHQWLMENRDFEGKGLLSIITSFESGMDWKPSFDRIVGFKKDIADRALYQKMIALDAKNFLNRYDLKKIYQKNYFIVKETAFNALYARDLLALYQLCTAVKDKDALSYKKRSHLVTESIFHYMYDKQTVAFYDIYDRDMKMSKVLTPTIFFPLILEGVDKKIYHEMVKRHLLNEKEFATPYPAPSVAVSEPSYYPYQTEFLWRGPTWIFFNWFLFHCLKEKGYAEKALQLRRSVKELIEKSGFREYYHPFTGEGYGARNFTWSGLIVDMQ